MSFTLESDPEEYAKWIHQIMTSACNASAPLVTRNSRRKQVYWWSETVSVLRRDSIKARRRWYRSKCGNDLDDARIKRENYTNAKKRPSGMALKRPRTLLGQS